MKINEITHNISSKAYTKKQISSSCTRKEDVYNANLIDTPNNPKYYQAINYINFTSGFLALPKKDNNETIQFWVELEGKEKIHIFDIIFIICIFIRNII